MNLKAIFPAGVTAITVNGLHQWDYGRTLEITADDLPALVEVHFACPGMKEAEVRVCSAASGTASAVIPDRCLEQTAPITAWVFIIDDTAGYTVKTITLPVIARVKPQPSESVPEEHYDRYTELITEVNAAIATLAEGDVKVRAAYEADHATEADSATSADSATFAQYASEDTSKGTIEERLTTLGFREGTVTLDDSLGGTVSTNTLKRQGNYVIGAIERSGGSLVLTASNWPDGGTLKVGTVPEGFRPKADVVMGITVDNIMGMTADNNYAVVSFNDWYCGINTAGEIILYLSSADLIGTEIKGLKIYIGYEAA